VPFFNFHALKYNANTVLMPLWALATWTFLRSYETRKPAWAIAAGLAAAAAMLGKYWSLILLAGFGIAALLDCRRALYFRSPAPWLTIAAGALAMAPHFVWLHAHDFAPFDYAVTTHPASLATAVWSGLAYVVGAAAYAAPLLIGFTLLRPSVPVLADTLWPAAPERRLAVLAFALPILLPAVAAVATHSDVVSLWSIGSLTLTPVVLFASPELSLPRASARRILAACIGVPLVAVLVSPIVAVVVHRQGVPNRATHYSALATHVERLWRQTTERPLKIVSSYDNLVYGTLIYFSDRPSSYEIGTPALSPWITAERLARDGVAYYCPVDEGRCMEAMEKRLAATPPARREEVTISRTYFGAADAPDRFVIAIVPPAK